MVFFLVSLLSLKGYACSTKNLVSSWREQWSATPGTTSPTFPFGIVTLADGTSEGHGHNMANFRSAQMAGYAFQSLCNYVCSVWREIRTLRNDHTRVFNFSH